MSLVAPNTDGVPEVVVPDLPSKTAYYVLHAKWVSPATPGSTITDGYEMSMILEGLMREKLTEILGLRPEVFVQVDVR